MSRGAQDAELEEPLGQDAEVGSAGIGIRHVRVRQPLAELRECLAGAPELAGVEGALPVFVSPTNHSRHDPAPRRFEHRADVRGRVTLAQHVVGPLFEEPRGRVVGSSRAAEGEEAEHLVALELHAIVGRQRQLARPLQRHQGLVI